MAIAKKTKNKATRSSTKATKKTARPLSGNYTVMEVTGIILFTLLAFSFLMLALTRYIEAYR